MVLPINADTITAHAQWIAASKTQGGGNYQLRTTLKQKNKTCILLSK